MPQQDDKLKSVLEQVEFFNNKFVGTIQHGNFVIFGEDGTVKDTRLTKIPEASAFPPESQEISLNQHRLKSNGAIQSRAQK